jgi:hypothetical protein
MTSSVDSYSLLTKRQNPPAHSARIVSSRPRFPDLSTRERSSVYGAGFRKRCEPTPFGAGSSTCSECGSYGKANA